MITPDHQAGIERIRSRQEETRELRYQADRACKTAVQKFLSDVSKDTSRLTASRRVRTARREPMLAGVGMSNTLGPQDTRERRSDASRWTEVPPA